jgi:hypothetical protein
MVTNALDKPAASSFKGLDTLHREAALKTWQVSMIQVEIQWHQWCCAVD